MPKVKILEELAEKVRRQETQAKSRETVQHSLVEDLKKLWQKLIPQ